MDYLVCFTGMVKPEKQSKNEVMDSWVLYVCDDVVCILIQLDGILLVVGQCRSLTSQNINLWSTLKGYHAARFKCDGHFVPMNSNFLYLVFCILFFYKEKSVC